MADRANTTGIDVAVLHMTALADRGKDMPEVRGWAKRIVQDDGATTPADQAKAILHALRSRVYVRQDADDEAIAFATCCRALQLETRIRGVRVGPQSWTVEVDVQQSEDEWVTFKMGEQS